MKTLAEIAQDRFNRATMEMIFNGEELPPGNQYPQLFLKLVKSPQGTRTFGLRSHVLETVEFDDGSHLDILNGAVFAW